MATTRVACAVDTSIQRLKALDINFVAVDFDRTINDVHTCGRWNGTAEELAMHIRPEFQQLLPALLANDIHVAIVTFSPQVKMVKQVLETLMGPDLVARIPIRGDDKSWTYNGKGSKKGKQPYMASAVEELEQNDNIRITRATSVLIDDDIRNIEYAVHNGVRAVWLNPKKPHHLFRDLKDLQ